MTAARTAPATVSLVASWPPPPVASGTTPTAPAGCWAKEGCALTFPGSRTRPLVRAGPPVPRRRHVLTVGAWLPWEMSWMPRWTLTVRRLASVTVRDVVIIPVLTHRWLQEWCGVQISCDMARGVTYAGCRAWHALCCGERSPSSSHCMHARAGASDSEEGPSPLQAPQPEGTERAALQPLPRPFKVGTIDTLAPIMMCS
jgi:hypothetical protein